MKPDTQTWEKFHRHAEAQLRPGFAQQVLRQVRAVADRALLGHLAFAAIGASACLAVGLILHTRATRAESARNLANWQAISNQVQYVAQLR